MDDHKRILESIAMDLKRVAIGMHRGSFAMADKFKTEALKRGEELEAQGTDNYLRLLLARTKTTLYSQGDRVAEDALMYSVLFQNLALRYKTRF